MGIVYRAICPSCNYEKDFCLGIGLGSINLLQSIKVLPEGEKKAVMHMRENAEIDNFVIENKLTECTGCNVLKEKTIIKIKDKTAATNVFGNMCSSCGKKMHIYEGMENGDSFKVRCPNCREGLLRFSGVGHWD